MRTFEIVLLLANLFSLVLLFKRPSRKAWTGALVANLAAFLAHGMLDGLRYQMAFAYLFVFLFILYALVKLRFGLARARSPLVLRIGAGLVAVIFLWLSAYLSYALPVFDLPAPTGDYAVGVQYFHWVDEGRADPFLQPAAPPRELMVKLYYPAVADDEQPFLPYLGGSPELARIFAGFYHLPAFAFDQLTLVTTHSKEGLRVTGGLNGRDGQRFPVVLFLHGAGTGMEVQTAQSEDLASRGYVVAAIDHTYVSAGTIFPDRVVEHQQATTNFEVVEPAEIITQIMADDARFVIRKLAELNEGSAGAGFVSRLDLERIGVIGHSVGGAAAYNLAINEPRVKAAVNLDGVVYITPGAGRVAPVLVLASETFSRSFVEQRPLMPSLDELPAADQELMVAIHGGEAEYQATYERARQNQAGLSVVAAETGGVYTIQGSAHMKFTDLGLFIGDPNLRELIQIGGSTTPARCLEITRALTAAFFDDHLKGDQHLKGQTAPALLYPELRQVQVR